MNRPDFLDQPHYWTQSPRDSRGIARQSTAFFGPYTKPEPLGHRVVKWLSSILLVVILGAVAMGF